MFAAARSKLSGLCLGAGNLISFALAFFGTCALLGTPAAFPNDIREKLHLLQTKFRDCDVLFFGSSRVVHQIAPKVFDQTVSAALGPVRSFNFGVDSLWPPESFYVLREILKHPTPRLRWIFIELMPIEGTLREGQDKMARTLYWHDRRHTDIAKRAVMERNPRWSFRVPLLWRHERLWLKKVTHQGEGSLLLRGLLWPEEAKDEELVWEKEAGYLAAPDEAVKGETRQWFLRTLGKNGEDLTKQSTRLPKLLRREYLPIIAAWRARGVEPIFFISPGLSRKTNYREAPGGARLLSFARPDLYPELFSPEMFRDGSHLNAQGSALYTPLLARKFLEIAGPQP